MTRRPAAVVMDDRAAVIEVARERLWVGRDLRLDGQVLSDALVVAAEGPDGDGIGHAIRLPPGGELLLEEGVPAHGALFEDAERAARARLRLRFDGAALLARADGPDQGVTIGAVDGAVWADRLLGHRREAWALVQTVLAEPLAGLDARAALATLEGAIASQDDPPERARATDGSPGALVDMPAGPRTVILGDLHGAVDNLLTALTRDRLVQELERGEAVLVIIGDAVHPDEGAEVELTDMKSSLLVMDLLVHLLVVWPRRVFFLRGNHDSFSPDVTKRGVMQGLLWARYLADSRGPAYLDAMARFYARCPLVARSDRLAAVHAGPPRGRVSRQRLVDALLDPAVAHELTWTRRRMPGIPAGYTAADVKRLRRALALPARAPVVAGHFVGDMTGTVWRDVAGMRDHHVVYSSRPTAVGSMAEVRGQLVARRWSVEALLK